MPKHDPAPLDKDSGIKPSSLSDSPTKQDGMGFGPYVQAVAAFLAHPDTKPPLTLSVEGEWGSGKSSFMLQLQNKLKGWGGYTVWFNAWRHEKEDELWASFALQFTEQLASQIPWYWRPFLHAKLAALRFNWRRGWWELVRVVALTALFIFVLLSTYRAVFQPDTALYQLWHAKVAVLGDKKPLETPKTGTTETGPGSTSKKEEAQDLKDLLPFLLKVGGPAALTLLFFAIAKKVAETIGNPLHNQLTKYMQDPELGGRSSFIEDFHRDFSRLVEIYLGKNRVFVFVDDLDRCDVPKAADLMQALNLLISNSAPVFYILGLDREKIAAGLAAKYDKLLPYLPHSASDEPDRVAALEFGFSYLEKFIQIPFLLPKMAGTYVRAFLKSLSNPTDTSATKELSETDLSRPPEEVSVGSSDVDEIVDMVAPALEYNPRRIKQFINLFRLRALLAYQTGLLGTSADPEKFDPMTLEQLGKLVAIELRWPMLFEDLASEPDLLLSLGEDDSTKPASNPSRRLQFWSAKNQLKELIGYLKLSPSWRAPGRFSLARVDVNRLLQVSPLVVGRGFVDDPYRRAPWKPLPEQPLGKGQSAEELLAKRQDNWQSASGNREGSGVKPRDTKKASEHVSEESPEKEGPSGIIGDEIPSSESKLPSGSKQSSGSNLPRSSYKIRRKDQ